MAAFRAPVCFMNFWADSLPTSLLYISILIVCLVVCVCVSVSVCASLSLSLFLPPSLYHACMSVTFRVSRHVQHPPPQTTPPTRLPPPSSPPRPSQSAATAGLNLTKCVLLMRCTSLYGGTHSSLAFTAGLLMLRERETETHLLYICHIFLIFLVNITKIIIMISGTQIKALHTNSGSAYALSHSLTHTYPV